jgi:hypothetical protein
MLDSRCALICSEYCVEAHNSLNSFPMISKKGVWGIKWSGDISNASEFKILVMIIMTGVYFKPQNKLKLKVGLMIKMVHIQKD